METWRYVNSHYRSQQSSAVDAGAADPKDSDSFGFSVPLPELDYSYAPLLDSKPFGERNCGTGGLRRIEPALRTYAPFVKLLTGTQLQAVVFEGTGESAIDCMILLARVQEKRLQEAGGGQSLPYLYKWKQLALKYNPASGTKLIWIPVMPSEQEKADSTYLERTAKRLLAALGTPLEELHSHRVQLTTGYDGSWVTLTLAKDGSGEVVQTIISGMGPPLSFAR